MASQLKKTVKPSGGDYTSLEACMNANEQNLVSADKYFDVEIDGSWSSADTSAVTIHNYTTDATRYINIYTTATARHSGKYDTTKYRIEADASVALISMPGSFFYVEGIQGTNTNTAGHGHVVYTYVSAGGTTRIRSCIFIGAGTSHTYDCQASGAGAILHVWNCVGKTSSGSNVFGGTETSGGVVNILNCVGIANSGSAFAGNTSDIAVKNCYGYSASGTAIGGTITVTTSASDDGSASTATVAYTTDTFVNVTGGSEDFHLVAGSGLINQGTDLSATFTDDIDGTTRPTGAGTWDIGVDEYVAATGWVRGGKLKNII